MRFLFTITKPLFIFFFLGLISKVSVARLVNAEVNDASTDEEDVEFSNIYQSPQVFMLNYAEMEKKFKVYIYPDCDPNTFYQTPRKITGKYGEEFPFFFSEYKRESITY